jgi:hypothetical protein
VPEPIRDTVPVGPGGALLRTTLWVSWVAEEALGGELVSLLGTFWAGAGLLGTGEELATTAGWVGALRCGSVCRARLTVR